MISAWVVASVLAAGPVIVTEAAVEPYRLATQGAESALPGATQVEPDDAALADRLKDATVVVAVGRKALKAARAHVAGKPVVFCMVLGVTRADLSGIVTGVPLEPDPGELLRQLQALTGAKSVGVAYDPAESGFYMERASAAAATLGIKLFVAHVTDGKGVQDATEQMLGRIDALWLPPSPRLYTRELSTYLLGEASERKTPIFAFQESLAGDGALAALALDYLDSGTRAGQLAASILAKPEAQRLPVPPPAYAPGTLVLNAKTAAAFGLKLPPDLVAGAKRVIR